MFLSGRRLVPNLLCFLLPALSAFANATAQSSALSECTRALYWNDYAQAEQLATDHLRRHPADVPVRVILGRAELAQGKFLSAFEDFRKALASDPRNIDALYYLSLTARAL